MNQGSDRFPALSGPLKNGENGENGRCRTTWSEVTLAFRRGVPDLRTERREMPTSPASDPSTGSGLLWTGTSAGRAPALGLPAEVGEHPAHFTHDHVVHFRRQCRM